MPDIVKIEYSDVFITVKLSQRELDHVAALSELGYRLNGDFLQKAFGISSAEGVEAFKRLSSLLFEALKKHATVETFLAPKEDGNARKSAAGSSEAS